MYSLAKDGNKKAKIIWDLQGKIGLVISAILACATILNALTVAVTTKLFSEILGNYAIILAPIVTSVLIVLFAEVLPKMLTISNPEGMLLPSAYFIKYTHLALKPLNNIIGFMAKHLISLLKFSSNSKNNEYENSLDELRGAIALHKGIDTEDTKKEKEMLQSVLDLGTIQVGTVMIHRKNVTMMSADEKIDKLFEQVMNCPFSRVPLWKDNIENIVGILHIKDLIKAMKNPASDKIDIMDIAIKPWFIPENKTLLDQLQSFKTKHEHFAIVVDEYGCFMGIVTLEDIIEEIVGNIEDEHDLVHLTGIREQDDGSYIVDGSVNIRDLNREIASNFRSDIAATVAGLVINSIGIIPEVGQTFILYGYRFEVLKRHRTQVTLIKITKLAGD
jgi:Mg2+/Co2+ transporter CorB